MKKLLLACLFLLGFCFLPFAHASAATQSSDTMILEWRAEKAWIDKGDLSRIENGRSERGPSLEIVCRIAAGLGVPPADLLA